MTNPIDPHPAKQDQKNTAILIIHGIGDQNPYESLDDFVRGFFDHFKSKFSTYMLFVTPGISNCGSPKGYPMTAPILAHVIPGGNKPRSFF